MSQLNGRLAEKYIKDDDHQTTPNGKLINEFIEKYSLMLLISSSICSGLWTQFGKNSRTLVLDYVIISQEMIQYMKNVKIDDSRSSSLFRTIKEKNNKYRTVYSDHVSIFIDLDLEKTEPKIGQKKWVAQIQNFLP